MVVVKRQRIWYVSVGIITLVCLIYVYATTDGLSRFISNSKEVTASTDSGSTTPTRASGQTVKQKRTSALNVRRRAAIWKAKRWPAVRPIKGPQGVEIAAQELLVTPSPGRNQELLNRLQNESLIAAVKPVSGAGVYRVLLADDVSLQVGLETIRSYEESKTVTTNAIVRGSGRKKAKGNTRSALWNLKAAGLHPEKARQAPELRSQYVIALLDSGVAKDAPGLSGVEIVDPLDTFNEGEFPNDENGHGTFLANLMVGNPGIARGAALMPIRVLDENLVGTEASLVAGMHHATLYGADVINLSLVFSDGYRPTQLLDGTFASALASDAIIVGAAGNTGQAKVAFPAAFPGVVAVGAATLANKNRLVRTDYSNWGPGLDLLAPGGDLGQDENRDDIPDGIIAESFDPSDPQAFAPWLYAGTSQAAAHVSAGAVWVLAADGARGLVVDALRQSAGGGSKRGLSGFDIESGSGNLDIWRATQIQPKPAVTGVQVVPVLRMEGESKAVGAVITLVDEEENAIKHADVHARFWCSVQEHAVCTTDKSGICIVDGGRLSSGCDLATVVIEAVVMRDGRLSRPYTVASQLEVDQALQEMDGTGFGSSSLVWYLDSSFTTIFWQQAIMTWLLFGSGTGSALPPTVVALSEDAANQLLASRGDLDGTGFGSSSLSFYSINWLQYYFIGGWFLGWSTAGSGFGSSSLSTSVYWSGWTFLWYSYYLIYGGGFGSSSLSTSVYWSSWAFWAYYYNTWLYGAEMTGSPLHELAGTLSHRTQVIHPTSL